jgi:hypothetical protein
MKLYQRMDGKYLVVIRGGAVCEEGGASRNAAVRYYLPYYGAAPAIELDGNSFEIRLDAGRETPLVTFLWSTPGENALHTEGRSRSSVMVEATDQSARVLIDLNPTSFAEEVGAALRSEGETLARRVLNDAISNRIYELVFSVKKGPLGLPELEIAGIAEVSMQGGITPIPFETVTDGTGIFVRMPDGHAFSVNKFPSSRLQVASYGRVLDRRLLSRVWSFISAPVDIFLGNIAMLPAADDPSFYMIERNRLTARDAVAKRFRVVPETIWDMKSSFPKGLTMHKQGWDPQRSQLRTYDRGPLHMDVTLSKNGMQIDAIRVTYQLNESTRLNIPAELFTHNGRPFIGLGGPFAGVVFYADAMRGRPTIREVTHPAVREALERDLGREPMGRPRFKADTSGHVYEYPPLEGGLAEAVNKQLRMSRMWRLKDGGVLPDDTAERERLADMLFPDSGTRKPEAIEVLEKVARNPVVKETVKKILGRLARGELDLSGMDGLNRHWGEYEASPSLYSLARVGFELCKLSVVPAGDAAAKKAVMLDTRKRIMSAPIGKDVIVELIRKTHGEALLKYLGVENASVSSLEELSVLIRGKVGETGWNKLHSEIEGYEREGRLAMHEEIGLLLEAAQAGLEGTGYNPQKGARRMRAFSERLKISVVAPTDGFSWSSTGANGYLNGIGTTALPDMVRSLDGGKVDPKDISRDGPQRVCSARDGGSSVMSDVLKRFRETQKAARKAGETAGRARKK